MDEVQLEESFSSRELGQHRISMRHRTHVLLGLSVDRTEIDGKAKFLRSFLGHDERSTCPLRGRVAIYVSNFQKFVAFLLHEIELLRRIGAPQNLTGRSSFSNLISIGGTSTGGSAPRRMRNTSLKSRIMALKESLRRFGRCLEARLIASETLDPAPLHLGHRFRHRCSRCRHLCGADNRR